MESRKELLVAAMEDVELADGSGSVKLVVLELVVVVVVVVVGVVVESDGSACAVLVAPSRHSNSSKTGEVIVAVP